jgi:hypothetical protein
MSAFVRAHEPVCGSATRTFVSVESPEFVTVIVKVAESPELTVWLFGPLLILIDGWMTVTGAVSVSVTSGPAAGVPVAVAEFVNDAVTFAWVQV